MMIAQYQRDMEEYATERAQKETQLAGLEHSLAALTAQLVQSGMDGNRQTNMNNRDQANRIQA